MDIQGEKSRKDKAVRENLSQQFQHQQVSKGTGPGARRVSAPCWHVIPVAIDPCTPLATR